MKVIEFLKTVNAGDFFSLKYISDVKLTAKAKKDGITSIVKIVCDESRTGVEYDNMKDKYEPKDPTAKCWWHHVIEKRIAKHNDKEEYYAILAPFKNNARDVTYIVNGAFKYTFEDLLDVGWIYKPSPKTGTSTILLKLSGFQSINGQLCTDLDYADI